MRRLLSIAILLTVAGALAPAAAAPPPTAPVDRGLDGKQAQFLLRQIAFFRSRAYAWVRLTYFDEARRELREANGVFQAAVALSKKHTDVGTPCVSWTWNLSNELELLRLREKAHKLTLATFALPADTLGLVHIVPPYRSSPWRKPHRNDWHVVYTTPPESLTKQAIAGDPMRFTAGLHIPGSRSYAAYYVMKPRPAPDAVAVFEKRNEVALPGGVTPYAVRTAGSGRVLVRTTRNTGLPPSNDYPTGAVLLVQGKIPRIAEGPCAGPVIVPGQGENRIDALATDWQATALYAMKNTKTVAVCATHTSTHRHLNEQVTFEGAHIVEITRPGNPNIKGDRTTLFKPLPGKRLTHEQVKLLGRFYELRHELSRRRIVVNPMAFHKPKIEFNAPKGHWVLTYKWGRRRSLGGPRIVVLDAQGRLVSVKDGWRVLR